MVRGDQKDATIEHLTEVVEKQRQTLALFHLKTMTLSVATVAGNEDQVATAWHDLSGLVKNMDEGPQAYVTALQAAQAHSDRLAAYVHHRTFCEGVLAIDGSLYYKDCTCGLRALLPPVPDA